MKPLAVWVLSLPAIIPALPAAGLPTGPIVFFRTRYEAKISVMTVDEDGKTTYLCPPGAYPVDCMTYAIAERITDPNRILEVLPRSIEAPGVTLNLGSVALKPTPDSLAAEVSGTGDYQTATLKDSVVVQMTASGIVKNTSSATRFRVSTEVIPQDDHSCRVGRSSPDLQAQESWDFSLVSSACAARKTQTIRLGQFDFMSVLSVIARLDNKGKAVLFTLTVNAVYNHVQGDVAIHQVDGQDHIEVAQVVQDAKNSIPLVAGKPTIARVFVKSVGTDAKSICNVTGTLTAEGFSGAAPRATARWNQIPGPICAELADPDRAMSETLDFRLPEDWTRKTDGPLRLRASVEFMGGTDPNQENNVTKEPLEVRFQKPESWPEQFRISYLEVCLPASPGKLVCPSEYVGTTQTAEQLSHLLPAPPGGVIYEPAWSGRIVFSGELLPTSRPRTEESVKAGWRLAIALLRLYWLTDSDFGAHMLVGWLPGSRVESPISALNLLGLRRFGPVTWMADDWMTGVCDWQIACPSAEARLAQGVSWNLGARVRGPTTGEMGYEVHQTFFTRHSPSTAELMSEFRWTVLSGLGPWIAPENYRKLYDTTYFSNWYGKPAPGPGPASAAGKTARRAETASEYLILSGAVRVDGTGGRLEPAYRVVSRNAAPASDPAGNFVLRIQAPGADPLEYRFALDLPEAGPGVPEEIPFVLKVPAPAGTARLTLLRGDVELGKLAAGSAPPGVRLLAPQPGEVWQGTQTVRWSGSDPDGRRLLYALLYSWDNGGSWTPLATHLEDTQFEVDCTRIRGGKDVLFRVIASAGLDSATASVGPIEVLQKPRIETDVNTLDFRNVTVGQARQMDIMVTNPGSGPALVTVEIPGDGPFRVASQQSSFAVPPESRRFLTIYFHPVAAGAQSARLILTGNNFQQPAIEIVLTGRAYDQVVPDIVVTPTVLDFGRIAVGQAKEMKASVSNAGGADLRITALAAGNTAFTVSPPAPLTVAPGANVEITVRFTPRAAGPAADSLRIASDDPGRPTVTIALAGAGEGGPALNVTPAALDFGSVTVGQSKDLTLSVANSGNAALAVKSASLDSAAYRWVSPSLPFSLNTGAKQEAVVRFTPAAAGAAPANLVIASDDPARPTLTVPLSGAGAAVAGTPGITLTPAALEFGSVTAGQFKDLTIALANTGSAALSVKSASLDHTAYRWISPPLPFSLNPGAKQDAIVRFAPAAAGATSASLVIASDDPARPTLTVPLNGTGLAVAGAPQISFTPAALDFGAVLIGSSKDLTFDVRNSGTAELTVIVMNASNPQFSVVTPTFPLRLAPGLRQTVTIRFRPVAAGPQRGQFLALNNDPLQPGAPLAVEGAGVTPPVSVLLSDTFARSDADACGLGKADLRLGGTGDHYYLPVFTSGAVLASGALQNAGGDFGGVQFTAGASPCSGSVRGEDLGPALRIRADLLVPSDARGNITRAGPYFRSRAAAPRDGIIGGTSAGYWVQLASTGEVFVKRLNPQANVARSGRPASFDNRAVHTLEIAVQNNQLQVVLDGRLLTFSQDGQSVTTVSVPPTDGTNNGTAGIAFSAEDNRGQIGGQRASSLVVSRYQPFGDLPVLPLGAM